MSSVGRLLLQKNFYPLFWTQFLGAFNDNFLKNCLVIAVALKSVSVFGRPSEQAVALAGGLFILPFFLFSSLAGELSDKYNKHQVLQATKILEIVVMIFSALALSVRDYDFLMITLFFMGLQSAFFGPAKFSILPQHLPKSQLLLANAWIEAGTFLAILLGTLLGGLVIAQPLGHELSAGVLLLVSVLGYWTSRGIPPAPASHPKLRVHWNLFATTWQQFCLAKKTPGVFAAMILGSWFWFVGAFILSLLPVFCIKYFNSDEKLITFFLTIFSVGIGLGSFICSRVSKNKIDFKTVFWGAMGMSLCLAALAVLTKASPTQSLTLWDFVASLQGFFVTLVLGLLSVASGLYIVPLNAWIQEVTPVQLRSRVIAAYNINNSFFMVVSSLLLMVLFSAEWGFSALFLTLFFLSLPVPFCVKYSANHNSRYLLR